MNQYKFEENLIAQSGFNIRKFLIIFALVLIVAYGLFNARSLIMGPTIEIYSPSSELETEENVSNIKGMAKNISFLTLNERPISVSPEGIFDEKILLSPGLNIIEIKAKDRFKNEIEKTLKIYYKQSTSTQNINSEI